MSAHTEIWSRAANLFTHALDLGPTARAAYLDVECSGDDALRDAVKRLLDAHDRLGPGTEVPQLGGWYAALPGALDLDLLETGARAGPFVVQRELGIGGMGRVYLASRGIDDGTQVVALKVAVPHRLAPHVQERLRRERQLLATLEHPHIARLVDAGELDDGRPYFAMEYVDGLPITRYCDEHGLSVHERIRLVLKVLDAVEYAHQRLVVHRDIKASNVLVGAGGVPKLLDFGIAKPLPADAREADLTIDAQRFFSPASAAPEQIQGGPTTAATDVYALGVLLFELLTGRLPLETDDRTPSQLARDIADTIPPTASQAIARAGQEMPQQAEQIARHRNAANAAALRRQLRGDLDHIVARALRKEPSQRYASVERLAQDLRAVLESRPIAARRDERAYRLWKFAQRHTAALALGGIAVALALAFVTSTVLQTRQLALARDRAEARRVQAERVTAFLVDLFRASDPSQARGHDPTARELLARGATRLAQGRMEDPETHAALSTAIADVDLALNDYDNAERHSADALRLRSALPGIEPAALRESHRQRARVAMARGRYAEADSHLSQALAGLSDPSADTAERLDLLRLRATTLQERGRLDEAVALWERLDREHQQRFGAHDRRSLQTRSGFARALLAAGQDQRASQLLDASLRTPAIGAGNDPAVAEALYALALRRRDQDRLDEAERWAQAAAKIDLAVYGERHNRTAADFNALGTIAQKRRNYPEAVRYFERSLAIKQAVNGPRHPRVASAEFNLGVMRHLYMRDPAAAEPYLRAAVSIAEETLPPQHLNLAIYRLGWAAALHDLGRNEQAREAADTARRRFEQMSGQTLNLALAQAELACLRDNRTIDAATKNELAHALETVRKELEADDPKRVRLERCRNAPSGPAG